MPYFIADETREELEQKDEEIERLRQRVKELEADVTRLMDSTKVQGSIMVAYAEDAERYRAWRASALDEGYAEYDLQGRTEQDVDAMCDQMIEEASDGNT